MTQLKMLRFQPPLSSTRPTICSMPYLLLLMSSQLLVLSSKDHLVIKLSFQVVQSLQLIDQLLLVAKEVMEITKYDIQISMY